MRWEDLTPSDAIESADWIGFGLHPFNAYDVGAVVPTGFAAYARILHPAFTREREVRWAEVATWSGRVIHPEVQFHALVPSLARDEMGSEPFIYPPRNGVLPESQVLALADLLSRHTSTIGRCWFCLWDGYGYLHPGGVMELRAYRDSLAGRWARWRHDHVDARLPRPKHQRISETTVKPNPHRSYLLFSGPITKAAGWEDGPNIWWPDDRTWCVASEIDLPYTYVGGSKELIEEILKHRALEALPSDVGDGITYDSDKVNSL
ncbi:MAG TPA: hypothetical protein VN965_09245 [Candidatus Dormibacteraeota bacterium]|nr:hypothetical protein [Candidatus Dormibacteraeota bacterium]